MMDWRELGGAGRNADAPRNGLREKSYDAMQSRQRNPDPRFPECRPPVVVSCMNQLEKEPNTHLSAPRNPSSPRQDSTAPLAPRRARQEEEIREAIPRQARDWAAGHESLDKLGTGPDAVSPSTGSGLGRRP